jgi:hypothetical protein
LTAGWLQRVSHFLRRRIVMMTDWYQKSINTVALNGKAGRTQDA